MRRTTVSLVAILFCGLAPVALTLAPRHGEPVMAISLQPGVPILEAIAATEARILWMSRGGYVAVLNPADSEDVASSLYRNGASLVVAAGLLGACQSLPSPSKSPSRHTL